MRKEQQPFPSYERLLDFANRYYGRFEQCLIEYQGALLAQYGSNAPFGFDISDPFCVPGCNVLAYKVVSEKELQSYGIEPLVGNVAVYGPRIEDTFVFNHVAFRGINDPEMVLDVTVGQFAHYAGTTLPEWKRNHGDFFMNRWMRKTGILLAPRLEVRRAMKIIYPERTKPFHEVFHG